MANSKVMHRLDGEYEYDGAIYYHLFPKEILDRIKYNFELRDDDIMIWTYPKAGTTWLQEIVWLVMNNGDVSGAKSTLQDLRVPHLELDTRQIPGFIDILEKAESPRIFKTHLPYHFYKEQLNTKNTKLVFGVRNIKDTLVSYYYLYQMTNGLAIPNGCFNDFFELFKEKHLVYGDWFDNNLEYWKNREDVNNFFMIKYEDLHKDFLGTVKKLAKFLGKELSEETFQAIAKHVSFDEMKDNDMVNKSNYPMLNMDVSKFMRKGKVGDWKNHLSSEQNGYIDELCKEKLEGSGLKLDFEL